MITHTAGIPIPLDSKWGNYPRFRGDVDPAEPDPATILESVVWMNWCIRPSPRAWNIYSEGGVVAHYAVYFDTSHRFQHAAGHGMVFDAKVMGRTAAKRAFVEHLRSHPCYTGYTSAVWLLPDQMFRPGWGTHL